MKWLMPGLLVQELLVQELHLDLLLTSSQCLLWTAAVCPPLGTVGTAQRTVEWRSKSERPGPSPLALHPLVPPQFLPAHCFREV